MATNLLFKQNNILSTGIADTINLLTNITTGTINLASGTTTGEIFIGNIAASSSSGGTTYIGTGPKCDIEIGNGTNASTSNYNGCCTINKLQVGPGSGFRCVVAETIGAGLSGLQTRVIPGAPSGMGNPIVIASVVDVVQNNYIYVPNISVTGTDRFTYRKKVFTGASISDASSESIHYVAYWL